MVIYGGLSMFTITMLARAENTCMETPPHFPKVGRLWPELALQGWSFALQSLVGNRKDFQCLDHSKVLGRVE